MPDFETIGAAIFAPIATPVKSCTSRSQKPDS